jgi:hypothetical protein
MMMASTLARRETSCSVFHTTRSAELLIMDADTGRHTHEKKQQKEQREKNDHLY